MEFYNHLQVAAVVVAVLAVAMTAPSAAQSQAKAGCESSCGNISIPYPFGTKQDCYLDGQFLVVCDKTFDPPRATLQKSSIQILSISLLGEMTVSNQRAMVCYNSSGSIIDSFYPWMRFGRYLAEIVF